MRRAELVESIRGVQGGYKLAREPAQISLGQILEAVGETLNRCPAIPQRQRKQTG